MSGEVLATVVGFVGPTVAVMSFVRTSWEQRSIAGRSTKLGTSLTVFKAWVDLRDHPRCTFSDEYLDQQSALAEERVKSDARALYETSARKSTSLRVWLAVGAAVLAAMSVLLTVFKLDDVVNGTGWAEPMWWGVNVGALVLGGFGLALGSPRKNKDHKSTVGGEDMPQPKNGPEDSSSKDPETGERP